METQTMDIKDKNLQGSWNVHTYYRRMHNCKSTNYVSQAEIWKTFQKKIKYTKLEVNMMEKRKVKKILKNKKKKNK